MCRRPAVQVLISKEVYIPPAQVGSKEDLSADAAIAGPRQVESTYHLERSDTRILAAGKLPTLIILMDDADGGGLKAASPRRAMSYVFSFFQESREAPRGSRPLRQTILAH